MSVKKSLWISLAVVMAMSLVFLGCPTEASSSSTGERPAYEKTALWEAILEAQSVLNATPITALTGADEGKDIVKGTGYVTEVQYNAFSRDIESARTVAYGLRPSVKAITPTPEEQPALDKLDAAQTQFNAYKTAQDGQGNGAKTTTELNAASTPVVVTGTVDLDAVVALTGKTVTVAPGAKLTTSKDFTFDIGTGDLIIKNGGTLEIASETERESTPTAFTGTITVEAGGTFIDRTAGGWVVGGTADDGTYKINVGGVLIAETTVLVGPTDGANRGQKFQLKSGTIEVTVPVATTAAGEPLKYALDGDADLVGSLEVGGLAIDGTLTVADKVELFTTDANSSGNDDFLDGSETSAKIILTGTGSYMTILDEEWDDEEDPDSPSVDRGVTTTDVTWTFGGGSDGESPPGLYSPYLSGHDISGYRTAGPVVLQYNGTAWKK